MSELNFIIPNWPAPANVKALQTTRNGGVSLKPYASLNLGAHVNDDALAVAKNRQLLSRYLPSEPVWVNQVHGVEVIDAAQSTCLQNADASFATKKNVVCVTMTADCLPVLLCDNAGTVVAAVHAGWRGLCDGALEASIHAVCRAANITPNQLMAWLGPAIGPNAFEVGAELRAQFIAKDAQAAQAFKLRGDKGDKWLCNIYQIAMQRLNNVGVTQIYGATTCKLHDKNHDENHEENQGENFCTYTDEVNFFSYRRDNVTGRMASLIWLAE